MGRRIHTMKTTLFLSIIFCAIALPALGELTDTDLNKIRLIINEEIEEAIKPIKADIVTLQTDVAWMQGKHESGGKQFESVDKQIPPKVCLLWIYRTLSGISSSTINSFCAGNKGSLT